MRGDSAKTNFLANSYMEDISKMKTMSVDDCILSLRRDKKKAKSASYTGIKRNSQNKWEARLKNSNGMPALDLGVFNTEEEAAKAYDVAVTRWRGSTLR